jgi:hypothetical protein
MVRSANLPSDDLRLTDAIYNRTTVVRIASFLRNPFSFLFARSSNEERMSAYVIREHERGRSLHEILDDPYVRNRCSPAEIARMLERPEVIHAIGSGEVTATKQQL